MVGVAVIVHVEHVALYGDPRPRVEPLDVLGVEGARRRVRSDAHGLAEPATDGPLSQSMDMLKYTE